MELDIDAPLKKISDKLEVWAETLISMLPNIAVAILILIVFFVVARFIRRLISRVAKRLSRNKVIQDLIINTVYLSVLGLGVFIVLGVLNLDKTVTSLLAGIGLVGLVLGFAFQDIASNFVAGIILATRTPFRLGDIVEASDIMGTVIKTNLRFTTVLTFTGQEVYIPNKLLIQEAISNYSVEKMRRVDLLVGVSYAEDLRKVQEVAHKAVTAVDGIIKEKDVEALFEEFADSSINFTLMFWIPYPDNMTYLRLRSKAVIAIKEAFDANGITIPFPIRTLDFGIKGGRTLSEMKVNIEK